MSTYRSGKFTDQNLPIWQIFAENEFQTEEGWNGILGKNRIPVGLKQNGFSIVLWIAGRTVKPSPY